MEPVSHIASAYPPITDESRARLLADLEAHGLGNLRTAHDLRRALDKRPPFDPMISASDYRAMTVEARAIWDQQWAEQLAAFGGDIARMDPMHHSNAISIEQERNDAANYDAARDAEGHR